MRRILILAYYFPPIAASGSLRPAGFCAHLPSLAYQPTVLSADYRDIHPPINIDESLLNLVGDNCNITLISYVNWQQRLLACRERARRVIKPGSGHVAAEVTSTKNDDERGERFNLRDEIINRLFRFPDQQRGWGKAITGYAKNLSADQRPDVVLATANPWSALIAGAKIADIFGVPFVADFRDPWVDNPKPPLTPSLGRRSVQIERSIMAKATKVIANTPELAESFEKRYPEYATKFTAITNGYHESLTKQFAALPAFEDNPSKVELCYFGSVYELRKPTVLLRSLKRLLDEGSPGVEKLRLRFTGNWLVADEECNALAHELERKNALIREPNLEHAQYLAGLKASQFLLILQQDFPLQIPAKIYEYIASGRPVVMIGGDGATANLVEDAKLGRVCRNSADDIDAMLKELVKKPQDLEPIAGNKLKMYSYENLTKQLASCLDEAISSYHA